MNRWHLWFAWHPVRTEDHRLTWLRTVRRRREYVPAWVPCCEGGSGWWVYARDDGYALPSNKVPADAA